MRALRGGRLPPGAWEVQAHHAASPGQQVCELRACGPCSEATLCGWRAVGNHLVHEPPGAGFVSAEKIVTFQALLYFLGGEGGETRRFALVLGENLLL